MRNYLVLMGLIGVTFGAGYGTAAANDTASRTDVVARVHFAGTVQLAKDANAGNLVDIAALPETRDLREQTLQKLATAPFRFLKNKIANQTNDYALLIRPMLEDLIGAESYMEVRGATDPVPELMLAVRLDDNRAGAWGTNLSMILTSWTGIPASEIQAGGFKGWELKKHEWPNRIRFIRARDWVLFGWGQNDLLLQADFLQRIKDKGRPVEALKESWLDAWVDWPSLASRLPAGLPVKLPKMQLTVQMQKDAARPEGYVRQELKMKFPEPLGLTLDAWKIPTNAIHNPLTSFTAFRGIAPWLSRRQLAQELGVKPPPNQFFVWAVDGIPFETCFAMPATDATNYLTRMAPALVSMLNSRMEAWPIKSEARWTTNDEIVVSGNPFFGPHLGAIREPAGDFLAGGIFPKLEYKDPLPADLVGEVTSRTNLVCYDWEITGARVIQWRALSQLALIMADKPITTTDTPAQKWIDAVKKKLGNCGTVATLTAPDELTVLRNSTIGLTGVELTALAYWLDAPGFPLDATYYDETKALTGSTGKAPSQ
jgi:hypothetical protein